MGARLADISDDVTFWQNLSKTATCEMVNCWLDHHMQHPLIIQIANPQSIWYPIAAYTLDCFHAFQQSVGQ